MPKTDEAIVTDNDVTLKPQSLKTAAPGGRC